MIYLNYGIIQSFNLKDKNAQLPYIYHAAGKPKEERIEVSSTYYKNLLSSLFFFSTLDSFISF
jgi:hypothetical protein